MLRRTLITMLLLLTMLAVLPIHAQEATEEPALKGVEVSHENISFFLPALVAEPGETEAVAKSIPTDHAEASPWSGNPAYVEFRFHEPYLEGHDFLYYPMIRVYEVADFAEFTFEHSDYPPTLSALQTLLEEQPALEAYLTNRVAGGTADEMPFLPSPNAVQVLVAQPEYIEFEGGIGVRYITIFVQNIIPFSSTNFFYTFQGLTDDGRYYISAIFPVITPGMPSEEALDLDAMDWDAFYEGLAGYLTETLAVIDEQESEDFMPSLALLDGIMASLEFEE